VGLILDSSVVIAAERQGENVAQILKQIVAATGDQRAVLPSIGLTELVHGIYRAQSPAVLSRRDSFIRELLSVVEVYPYTKETCWQAKSMENNRAGVSPSLLAICSLVQPRWSLDTRC
jgi:predicted nucleic acid-binding protein